MDTNTTTEFWIEWDMGDYGPYATEADARAAQRQHGLAGSTITRTEAAA